MSHALVSGWLPTWSLLSANVSAGVVTMLTNTTVERAVLLGEMRMRAVQCNTLATCSHENARCRSRQACLDFGGRRYIHVQAVVLWKCCTSAIGALFRELRRERAVGMD